MHQAYTGRSDGTLRTNPQAWHCLLAERKGVCGICGLYTQPGKEIYWQPGRRNARHVACHERRIEQQGRVR